MVASGYGAVDKVTKAGDSMSGTLVLDGSAPLQIPSGAALGAVLTSDASGNATWGSPGGLTGLAPTGDTTGAADCANIAGLFALGAKVVQLQPGKFYINQPVVPPPYSALVGAPNSTQVSQTGGGTVLSVVSGFTGKTITDGGSVTLTAAILLLGQTFGGYSTVSEEQKIRNIMIDGTNAPASVIGIQSYGRTQRVDIKYVLASKLTGDGLIHTLDSAGNQPDKWDIDYFYARFCGGRCAYLRSADSNFYNILGSNNASTDTDILFNTCSNSNAWFPRSEHAAGVGIGYVCSNNANSSGKFTLVGPGTDQSSKEGLLIGGTQGGVTSITHATPVLIVAANLRRDGANGGSGGGGYAGYHNANYGGVVTVAGINVFPGVNDSSATAVSPSVGADITTIAAWSSPAAGSLAVNSVSGFTTAGSLTVLTSTGTAVIAYTGRDTTNKYFTGCTLTSGTGNVLSTTNGVASPNTPQIGALYDSGAREVVGPGYIQGATTAITDNSGGTVKFSGEVIPATGSSTNPTISMSPSIAAFTGTSLALTPVASPATDPLFINNANSGERAIGIRVVGQSNDRFKVTSDGKLSLGPGSATQDIALSRPSAGIVAVTDAGASGNAMLRVSASSSQASGTELFSAVANAAGDIAYIAKVTGDANNRLTVDSTGKIQLGPGSAGLDTNLYRASTGLLKTDTGLEVGTTLTVDGGATISAAGASGTFGSLLAVTNTTSGPTQSPVGLIGAGAGDKLIGFRVSGDTQSRLHVDTAGKHSWGPGSATQDVALQRGAAGRLDVSTDASAGTFQPVDPYSGGLGFLAPSGQIGTGNLPRASYSLNTAPLSTSGTIYTVSYYMPAGKTVTNITFMCGTGAVWSGATHGWYCLLNSSLQIVAVSADQTSVTIMGTASTAYPLAVLTSASAKYVTPYSGLYRLGIMLANTSGTQPNLVAGPSMATGVAGIAPITSCPSTGATGTSQTTPPTADGSVTVTLGSADGGKNYLAYVT